MRAVPTPTRNNPNSGMSEPRKVWPVSAEVGINSLEVIARWASLSMPWEPLACPEQQSRGLAYWMEPTAERPMAINWIFCRSSAALTPLAYRSQLKLMYGDHHQQPQKDCRYDELDPFPMSGEEHPVHGQPPSGYHAPPDPIHYHILGLMTNLEPSDLGRLVIL
jgi:hypothetical protein